MNMLLIGKAEEIDMVKPEVRAMLALEGLWAGGDSRVPQMLVPLLVACEGSAGLMLRRCYHVDLPGGGAAVVCGALGPHCGRCRRVGEFLCDFHVGGGRTCDKRMCAKHRNQVGPGVDYCVDHYLAWQQLGGTPPGEPWKQGELL